PLQPAHGPGPNWLTTRPTLKVVAQLAGRLVALARLLRHRRQADRLQVAWDLWVELAGRFRFVVQYVVEQHPSVAFERQLAGQDLVKDHTQAIHIAAAVDFMTFAARLLGAHVGRRAENLALNRQRGFAALALGEAEVHNLGKVGARLRAF